MPKKETSVLSKYLARMGYDFGTSFWHEEINGGLESPAICTFYQEELEDPIFPFSDFKDSIEKRKYVPFAEIERKYKVQKFSFLLMSPSLVRIWFKYREGKNDRFIVLRRNAEEIYQSKQATKKREKRFKKDHPLLNQTPGEIRENIYRSTNLLLSHKADIRMLHFPTFLMDYDMVWSALCEDGYLDFDYEEGKKEWNEIIDLSKVTSSEIEQQDP